MSRSVILTLLALVIFGLFGGNRTLAQGNLRVGTARVDITRQIQPTHLPASMRTRETLRACVLDDRSARAALIRADQGELSEQIWQAASKQIAAELNCPWKTS